MSQADGLNSKPALSTNASANASVEEFEGLRREFSRTPRPYLYSHDGLENDQGHAIVQDERAVDHGSPSSAPVRPGREEVDVRRRPRSSRHPGSQDDVGQGSSTTGSESGSEADDERPNFVKALPPATLRLRKGLKTGEEREHTLLTPGQLDERERRVQGYFQRQGEVDQDHQAAESEDERHRKEKEEVQSRRFAEFLRRTSEIALMGVILASVLCGRGVARVAWQWRRELLSHILTIVGLVLAYPVKLSIVDTETTHTRIWQRFRVPVSFDPATVLYPPLLPVLVALSIAPANPAVVLPNAILGLSALPQRLFPRSSRLGRLNAVHWLVSIIPLIVSENTLWHQSHNAYTPYLLKTPGGLSPETLVSLYPLHHALLQPLQYLTTTSLLVSELHLLSVVLINLLLLASSPQAVLLKACLWVGGVALFISCGAVLRWNVTLARVPRWKLRRPGHTAEERKSLVDAVSDLINLQKAAGAFKPTSGSAESDADEDEPKISIKTKLNKTASAYGLPKINTAGLVMPSFGLNMFEPQSATEPRNITHTWPSHVNENTRSRPRRNTLPEREPPEITQTEPQRQPSAKRKGKSANLLWCLQLTPTQAQRRKWLFAGFVYLAIVVTIMVFVRTYVAYKSLFEQEPIGWAIGYLFGQLPFVRSIVESTGLDFWIALPNAATEWNKINVTFPLHFNKLRLQVGEANFHLLLIAYWVAVLAMGLLTVFSLTAFVEVDTRRKVFHGVMVVMFLPAPFVDPCYCALALTLVLAVFLLLEIIRAGQVPPLGNAIGRFVAPYVDGRDLRGPVVVSHIFLLIGCAVPLWFSLASIMRAGEMPWKDWELEANQREVAMVAGVICVGMGDAAASLIGRRYGRHKWIWVGGKSIEGSAAFVAAVTIGVLAAKAWQDFGGWNDSFERYGNGTGTDIVLEWVLALGKAVFCACGASFMEAVLTGANDNVVVPVALWLLVKGMRL